MAEVINPTLLMILVGVGVGIFLVLAIIKIIFKLQFNNLLIFFYMALFAFVALLILNDNSGFLAMGFDSGGVASGPLTSSFILPLAIGVCYVLQGENKVLEDAFGIVAMVAMTPLITIQLLGFRERIDSLVKKNIRTKKMLNAEDDDQIINFM